MILKEEVDLVQLYSIPRTGGGDPISYGKIEPKSRYSPRMQGVYAMYSTFGDQKS